MHDDWPVIGEDKDGDGIGEPVLRSKKPNVGKSYKVSTVQDSDEFNETKFGLQWQWQANSKEGWAYPTLSGSLRMFSVYQPDSVQSLWDLPNIMGQKLPAEEFVVKLKVVFNPRLEGERFGLIVFGADYAYISLEKSGEKIIVQTRSNTNADKGGKEQDEASFSLDGDTFYLALFMMKGGKYRFGFSYNEKRFADLVKVYTAKPGRWVGARVGLFCLRNNSTNDAGFADIDWFRISKLNEKLK